MLMHRYAIDLLAENNSYPTLRRGEGFFLFRMFIPCDYLLSKEIYFLPCKQFLM
jgi:hypothetical protein